MKLIIAGSRTFTDYELLCIEVDNYLTSFIPNDLEIVSGGANGADKLGEKYAAERNINLKRFPANWDKFGKSAGFLRNIEMAKYATDCIVFWDGKSKGTKMMISLAEDYNLNLKVVNY